ncbi:hydrogenase maturation nickel metallochaperone HypA [Ectothiorhodospiraceae bacterium BW-2]|nr:hydrogenase maturation nickel metallochaperone HypA [Ectothiorhodospiraceae bacterium BW-2]
MHELSLCQGLVRQLEQLAADYPGKTIVRVELTIGPLAGIEPALLKHAFPIAAAASAAAEAELVITPSPITLYCEPCGLEVTARANRLICPHCGHWQTRLLSGDEMILQRIELED